MENITKIYSLLIHNNGLRIREISDKLELDKYYVADILFSVDTDKYWYQDDDSLWYAISGAIDVDQIEETEELKDIVFEQNYSKKGIIKRYIDDIEDEKLQIYIKEITQYPTLSNEEILELFKRHRNGERNSYELIVKSHLILVVSLAYLYRNKGVSFEDLIQEGNIGLLKAIDKFDDSKLWSFYRYAKSWILQAVWNALTTMKCLVNIPQSKLSILKTIRKFSNEYELRYGLPPSISDIQEVVDLDYKTISYLNDFPEDLQEICITDDLEKIESTLPLPDSFAEIELNKAYCSYLLSKLDKREQDILISFYQIGNDYYIPQTYESIGDEYGLTGERVRQIIVKSNNKIKERCKKHNKSVDSPNNAIKEILDNFDVKDGISKNENKAIERLNNSSIGNKIVSKSTDVTRYEGFHSNSFKKGNKDTVTNELYNSQSLRNINNHTKTVNINNIPVGEKIRYRINNISVIECVVLEIYQSNNKQRIKVKYSNGIIDDLEFIPERVINNKKPLHYYIEQFSNLHCNKMKGEIAPHKAILLLSVIELIALHQIKTNEIEYTEQLENRFYRNWRKYVGESSVFKNPKPGTPFWHLHYEPFWELVPYEGGVAAIASLQKSNPYTAGAIVSNIRYAIIDKELYELLQDDSPRATLSNVLIASIKK